MDEVHNHIQNSPVTRWGGLSNMLSVKLCPKINDLNNKLCLICQNVDSWTMDEVHTKLTWHNDITTCEGQFKITCEGSPNYSKIYFMNIFGCFDDHQMQPKNWPHYVWTSSCQLLFMNLLHNQAVQISDLAIVKYVQNEADNVLATGSIKWHHMM